MIFFDLDDTLLDDQTATARGLDVLHRHYGATIEPTRDELGTLWQRLLDQHFPRYLSGELSVQEQRRARLRGILRERSSLVTDDHLDAAFEIYLDGYRHGWTCFADVIPALSRLSRDRLGVITNGHREQQLEKLKHTGLAEFFITVVTPDDCGVAKPDPRIFVEACRRATVSVTDAVYVGDSWRLDVAGSRAAGLQAIWLRRGNVETRETAGDVSVIQTLDELPAALSSLRRTA